MAARGEIPGRTHCKTHFYPSIWRVLLVSKRTIFYFLGVSDLDASHIGRAWSVVGCSISGGLGILGLEGEVVPLGHLSVDFATMCVVGLTYGDMAIGFLYSVLGCS